MSVLIIAGEMMYDDWRRTNLCKMIATLCCNQLCAGGRVSFVHLAANARWQIGNSLTEHSPRVTLNPHQVLGSGYVRWCPQCGWSFALFHTVARCRRQNIVDRQGRGITENHREVDRGDS